MGSLRFVGIALCLSTDCSVVMNCELCSQPPDVVICRNC